MARERQLCRYHSTSSAVALPPSKEGPLAASYDPDAVERDWYEWWESNGMFEPRPAAPGDGPAKTFCMTIPPPNITGALHIGHALTVAVEDALARRRRMVGDRVLWVPGLDHAGIATQSVVERKLQKERGITRHDLGRDAFLDEVHAWYEQYGGRINDQLRVLGASLDWGRTVFTMDAQRSEAVTEAFVRLHDAGLIYRQHRMVNWCPHLRTVISDIEVDYESVAGPTKLRLPGRDQGSGGTGDGSDELKQPTVGLMHHFVYPLADAAPGDAVQELEVATTRLETMLGDAAVAVHPDDPRYAGLIGRSVIHPIHGTPLPIIGDAELVDMEVGTGAVKITPAHDPNDLLCARRHGLPEVNMLRDDGTLNAVAGKYAGVDRFAVRDALVRDLTSAGLYRGSEPHEMRLGLCSRSGDVLEPMLKPQWFVACGDIGADAARMVREGEVAIQPASHKATWFHWLDSVQDWCISRQLWWGHRVPAYMVVVDGAVVMSDAAGDGGDDAADTQEPVWIVARSEAEARSRAQSVVTARFGADVSFELRQDEDVLDTWFSSALFPITTLGWPRGASSGGTVAVSELDPELAPFYPLSVMETGHDILFFWVARMVMLCTHLTGERPFDKVLLHPIVRDKSGRKMSKSLGNVIDPLHVVGGVSLDELLAQLSAGNLDEREVKLAGKALQQEYPQGIAAMGADALRFTLTGYLTQGQQLNLDVQRVQAARHFGNKVWNAVKFATHHLAAAHERGVGVNAGVGDSSALGVSWLPPPGAGGGPLPLPERWILSRLAAAAATFERGFDDFVLGSAVSAAHSFVLSELCDVYLEWSKVPLLDAADSGEEATTTLATLALCVDAALRLLHPLTPFLTEELWQHLHGRLGSLGLPHSRADVPSVSLAPFPTANATEAMRDFEAEGQMEALLAVVRAARSVRKGAADVCGSDAVKELPLVVACDSATQPLVRSHSRTLERLLRVPSVEVVPMASDPADAPSGALHASAGDRCTVYQPLPATADTRGGIDAELVRLSKRQGKLRKQHDQLAKRLASADYVAKVPDEVQAKERGKLAEVEAAIAAAEVSADNLAQAREGLL